MNDPREQPTPTGPLIGASMPRPAAMPGVTVLSGPRSPYAGGTPTYPPATPIPAPGGPAGAPTMTPTPGASPVPTPVPTGTIPSAGGARIVMVPLSRPRG